MRADELFCRPVVRKGDEVEITVTADGYLYNMVRILTGTLLEVGQGTRRPEEMGAILASRAPSKGSHSARRQRSCGSSLRQTRRCIRSSPPENRALRRLRCRKHHTLPAQWPLFLLRHSGR